MSTAYEPAALGDKSAADAAPIGYPLTALLSLPALLSLTALVRLIGISRPLVGHFATKNVVYAMIARNWATGHAPLWHPTLDCLGDGQRTLHLLEIPVSAYLAGALWAVLGGSLDVWGRLVSVGLSTASVALMFSLVDRWHGRNAAWAAAVALALAPVSIIYGQAFMLEASVVCFSLATIWSLDTYLRNARSRWLAVAAGCLGLLLLTKIYMLALLPALAWMVCSSLLKKSGSTAGLPSSASFFSENTAGQASSGTHLYDQRLFQQAVRAREALRGKWSAARLVLVTVIAALPAVGWCGYVFALSEPGSQAAGRIFYSLRDSTSDHGWPHPLLTSADYYRGVMDSLTGSVLTPVGFVLALAGLAHPACRRHGPWLGCMGMLMVLLPRKFHEMNYYYLVILPPLCVLVGVGWQQVADRLRPGRLAVAGLLLVSVVFSLRYAVHPAFVTPAEDRSVVKAAAELRSLSEEGEPVVTVHGSTIDLLYYCQRPGWALSAEDPHLAARLAACRQQGARWLVVAALDPPRFATSEWLLPVSLGDGHGIYRILDGSLAGRDPAGRR